MKKLFLISFLIISTLSLRAQSENNKQVEKVVRDLFEALANRDTNEIKAHCTKDITLYENGEIWNVDTLVSKISLITTADYKRINTIEFLKTEVHENTAWTTYNNQAEVTKNGEHVVTKWLETSILVKEGKIWKIKTHHSNLVKRSTF